MTKILRPVWVSAAVMMMALLAPYLYHLTSSHMGWIEAKLLALFFKETLVEPFQCLPHSYTTEFISLDPLVIYIRNFIAPAEITALVAAGEPAFQPSLVVKYGRKLGTSDRTSQSAGLSRDDPAVQCVLARAQAFMGTMLDPERDDIGPLQLVRYTAGQRFNIHRDWYERPQPTRSGMTGRGRSWNRVASFFAVLQDNCTGGETHFPHIEAPAWLREHGDWQKHKDGGVAFRPVAGNAVFWVNLFANGTGDRRTMHAGLTVGEGLKTAMNIWPRQFYS